MRLSSHLRNQKLEPLKVMNKGDNRICGNYPPVFISKTNHISLFLRSDSDPKRDSVKNFVLRMEKTRGKYVEKIG